MEINVFNRQFSLFFGLIIAAETLSLAGYFFPVIGFVVFFVMAILVFILSLNKPEYGLYFVLAELFIGGKGHLFAIGPVSIRMGLFAVLLLAWLIKGIKNQEFRIKNIKDILFLDSLFLILYSLFFVVIIFGIILGLIRNQWLNVYQDANAWLFFALLPVFWRVLKEKGVIVNILRILMAAAAYLSLKTIITLYSFSHGLAVLHGQFYNWIRGSGVGEITFMSETMYRVFFQSQIYCLIAFLVCLAFLIGNIFFDKKSWILNYIALYLTSLAIIISQSRSYWLGGIAAIIFLVAALAYYFRLNFKRSIAIVIALIIMLISQVALTSVITGSMFTNRFENLPGEPAGASRLSQLMPLGQAIGRSPFFGYGFGKTLTYQSNDPRILKGNLSGSFTTYAFEWGYLDIVLKLGVIGLGLYLALIIMIFYQGFKISNFQFPISKPITLGFLAGLVALGVVNIFSPYLNHPLGIGYIMLLSAIYGQQ